MTALPDAVKAGIDDMLHGLSRSEIARRAEKMSENYRSGGASAALADPLDLAAYLVARMPATYAATRAALSEVARAAPDFRPSQLLDAGAGPGTAAFGAVEIWPGIETVRLVDSNAAMLDAARRLTSRSAHPALSKPHVVARDIGTFTPASADLVTASYALAEIPAARLSAAVSSLWEACTGILVLTEPGTPDGFERIRVARAALLRAGARAAAPCPHQLACPIAAPDWCHFSQRLPRSRDHMTAKAASVPFEDEKYSYVAAARETVALQPYAARIVGPVARTKAGLTLKLCEDGRIHHAAIPSRERDSFKRHRRAEWGDAVNL
jgi:ribosomal protein RSM22 (predicted rRNA methylase)